MLGCALASAALGLCWAASSPAASNALEEILVVETIASRLGGAGSISLIDGEALREIRPTHIHEALARVPGVWIARGSGQESLTAIRSAVLTGAGACGAFLYLEDGLPIRPAGFCNVNNPFELNVEQAQGIELWRGPASAAFGGNALHGALNLLTPDPAGRQASIEGGAWGHYRLSGAFGAQAGRHRFGLSANGSHWNGYREDTGYGQQKLSLVHAAQLGRWQVRNTLNATNLNQETGGYLLGRKAYADPHRRRSNPNPEAYRDAWALRGASHWRKGPWRISPYLRRSRMQFLQHFLPGQPREANEQTSGGLLASCGLQGGPFAGRLGLQLERMDASLVEMQEGPTQGAPFLAETRPPGRHYDYGVDSFMMALFYDLDWRSNHGLRLAHSLRAERLAYDYRNRHLVGNTRDDGTACGFGGCLYTRPASGEDAFAELAGRLAIERDFGGARSAYLALATGFRPPQITELYRLQRGQTRADLDSERLTSLEVGLKGGSFSFALFRERVRNRILREASGFNVGDGRTKSAGAEWAWEWNPGPHSFSLAGSYARHRYDFSRLASGGERIAAGNALDTAPRWLGNLRWRYQPSPAWHSELELSYVGKHYIDAANAHAHPGHAVVSWRGALRLGQRLRLFARLLNLLNARYAERADFAFGSHRYFPALPRHGYLGIELRL